MDYKIHVVHQHPLGVIIALHMRWLQTDQRQPAVDLVADGLHLPAAGAAADQEVVGEDGHFREVQENHILRFLFLDRFDGLPHGFSCATRFGLHSGKERVSECTPQPPPEPSPSAVCSVMPVRESWRKRYRLPPLSADECACGAIGCNGPTSRLDATPMESPRRRG